MASIKRMIIWKLFLLNIIRVFDATYITNSLKMQLHGRSGCVYEFDVEKCVYDVYCKSIINVRQYYDDFSTRRNEYECPVLNDDYYAVEVVLEDDSSKTVIESDTHFMPTHKIFDDNYNDYNDFLISSLDLSYNNYETTPLMKEMTNLKKLNISYNQITVAKLFDEHNSYNLLENIDFSFNKISYIISETENNFRSLKHLNISHNELSELQDAVFSYLLNLEHLDLSYNNISHINTFSFEGLKNLKYLQLAHNNLHDIDATLFRFNMLEELYLNDNNLYNIISQNFEKMIRLKKLDLSNNIITSIEKKSFTNLSSLIMLNLKNNLLRTIDIEILSSVKELQDIDLSYNKIMALPLYIFKEKKLSSFSFIGNSLEGALKKGMFEGLRLVSQLNLSYQKINSIEDYAFFGVEHVLQLLLNNNNISTLTPKSFRLLTSLNRLDLSHNCILSLDFDKEDLLSLEFLSVRSNYVRNLEKNYLKSLNKLLFLDLSKNNISKLAAQSFEFQTVLVNLQISDNPLQDFLEEETFYGLSSVPSLDLSCTLLSMINNRSFDSMIHLNELNISHSKLSELKYNSFINTGNIITIDLSYNLLKYFDVNTTDLINIQVLLLNNNLLKTLPLTFVNGMTRLNKLKLSNNSLSILQDTIFDDQTVLQYLDLSYNFNLMINSSLIAKLNILNVLNLSGTQSKIKFSNTVSLPLKVLEYSYCNVCNVTKLELHNLGHLDSLFLCYNNLTMLEIRAFANLSNLRQLDVSNNKITTIQPGVFKDNNLLHVLNISHNNIKVLSFGVFRGLYHISVLDVSFNYIDNLEKERFYEIHTLREVIADHNLISDISVEDFHGTLVEKISIGENPLPCKALVNLRKETAPSFIITAVKLVESGIPNYYGVSCINGNTKFKPSNTTENYNYNLKVLSDIHDILQNLKEKSSNAERNNIAISVDLENLNKKYINSNIEFTKGLSSIFNVSNEIKQANDQTNSFLARILKVLVATNAPSVKTPTIIPPNKDNATNSDIIAYISNKMKQDLENTLVIKKEKIISEVDEKLSKHLELARYESKNKTQIVYRDEFRSPLFVEICVALILIILICIVLFRFYRYKIYHVNGRTLSTRHIAEVTDNSTL